jgi:glutathione synthase/RimK-type ligase-like ATP-grasp enzyme
MSTAGGTERLITAALRRSADRRGLSFETFGFGWVARLSDRDRARHVFGYDFDLNPAAAAKIAGDKAATWALLSDAGVPAIEHRLFLRADVAPKGIAGNDPADMADFAAAHRWDVVCKTNAGTGGDHVFRVRIPDELEDAVGAVFSHHHAVALAPFVTADAEHRVIVLDGEPMLVYEKVPAPAEWRHNLGLGGRAVDVDDGEVRAPLIPLALAAMDTLGLRFASVDLMTHRGEVSVLEVNAGVMMEHYGRSSEERRRRVEEVYDRAVAAMFA